MAVYSRSSIQNINNGRFRIWKSKCIIEFNRKPTDIDRIYFYVKDPYKAKYQYLIKICQKVGIDHHNDPRASTEYSNDMHDVYKNINYYNPDK